MQFAFAWGGEGLNSKKLTVEVVAGGWFILLLCRRPVNVEIIAPVGSYDWFKEY